MQLGIFSRTYHESTLEDVFRKMTSQGIYHTQFNLLSAGLEAMPDHIDDKAIADIQRMKEQYRVNLTALSGTFNMIDPDPVAREEGCRRFEIVCRIARQLDIPLVTLCTGSRNPESKWKWHPDNTLDISWYDLMRTTERVLKSAYDNGVTLGVETEASNIIHSAELARKYLDQVRSDRLKIIMDGANLFCSQQIKNMAEVLEEAFMLLGKDIVLAHAKDFMVGDDLSFVAAGKGMLDYHLYIKLLKKIGYEGPLIMHELSETQVPNSIRFLKEMWYE